MNNLVIVFARNMECAVQWAVANGLPSRPSAQSGWKYGSSANDINGRSGFRVAILPSFHSRGSVKERVERIELLTDLRDMEARGLCQSVEINGDY